MDKLDKAKDIMNYLLKLGYGDVCFAIAISPTDEIFELVLFQKTTEKFKTIDDMIERMQSILLNHAISKLESICKDYRDPPAPTAKGKAGKSKMKNNRTIEYLFDKFANTSASQIDITVSCSYSGGVADRTYMLSVPGIADEECFSSKFELVDRMWEIYEELTKKTDADEAEWVEEKDECDDEKLQIESEADEYIDYEGNDFYYSS
jgi:uncharacterized protein YozE (UPF0346 family)